MRIWPFPCPPGGLDGRRSNTSSNTDDGGNAAVDDVVP